MDDNNPVLTYLERIPDKLYLNDELTRREKNEIQLIKRMIMSYFDVVKKNVNDLIPKTIITLLVKKVFSIFLYYLEYYSM